MVPDAPIYEPETVIFWRVVLIRCTWHSVEPILQTDYFMKKNNSNNLRGQQTNHKIQLA